MDAVKKRLACLHPLDWKCPPKIALSCDWHVATGEESEEAKFQKRRELKVPEAVYLLPSHIPPSPSSPLTVQEDHYDESHIPLIPITPIEEDGSSDNASLSPGGPHGLLSSSSEAIQGNSPSDIKPSTIGKSAPEAPPDTRDGPPRNASLSPGGPHGLLSLSSKSSQGHPHSDIKPFTIGKSAPEARPDIRDKSSRKRKESLPPGGPLGLLSRSLKAAQGHPQSDIKPLTIGKSAPEARPDTRDGSSRKESLSPGGTHGILSRSSKAVQCHPQSDIKPSIKGKVAPEARTRDGSSRNASLSPGGPHGLSNGSSKAAQGYPQRDIKPSLTGKSAPEAHPDTEADVALAAAAVVTTLMKSQESGSFVDPDLLIKILSDPKSMELLRKEVESLDGKKTEPVLGTKLPIRSIPSPSSRPGLFKEASKGHGVLKNAGGTSISKPVPIAKSVGKSSPKPDTMLREMTDKNNALIDVGHVAVSSSEQVKDPLDKNLPNKDELGDIIKKYAPVPGLNPQLSQFTFISQSDQGNSESGMPCRIGSESNSRSTLSTPEVNISSQSKDFSFGTMPNSYPLVNDRGTGSQLKTALSDAVRSSLYASPNRVHPDSQLMSASPDALRLNIHPFADQVKPSLQMQTPYPNQVQPSMQMQTPYPNQVQPSLQMQAPYQNQVQPGLQMQTPFPNQVQQPDWQVNAPLPNQGQPGLQIKVPLANYPNPAQLQPSVQTSSFLTNTGPSLRDFSYFRSLIKQHGDMQETQDHGLYFPPQGFKPVPYSNPNELMKIQRPCFFFNRPEGCKNGSNCIYLHDEPHNLQFGSAIEGHFSKRMKLDGDSYAVNR